jgi:hypothetical protein
MTRLDQKLDVPPAVCEASRPRIPIAAWATNLILALLAIWPAVALARAVASPDFSPTLANLIAGFTALILATLVLIALQPRERKRDLTLAAVACFGAFLVGDLLLGLKRMSARSVAESFLVHPSAQRHTTASLLSPSGRDRLPPVDRRSEADLRKVLAHYDKHPPKMTNISLLLPAIEAGDLPPFLPLSWPADAILPGCNEGDQRQFPILRTDRFGFNNEDWVYPWDREKVMLVGDSFAVGQCVHQEQSVQGVMRRSGLAAFSTGIGGHGPLLALAALSEYGPALKPRSVFWLYFDGNDLVDLRDRELASSFLAQYLNDGFTQRLIERQGEVDRFWRAFAEDGWARLAKLQEQARIRTPDASGRERTLATVRRELDLPDLPSLSADADVLRVFAAILRVAERRVRAWGGELYFVMIPNQDDYRGHVPPYRRAVLDAVHQTGLPVIDLDRPLRASGDPMQFYPLRTAWGHFNAEGYRLFAHSLIDAMIERRQRSGDPIALEEIDPDYRRLARVNALLAALRRLNPAASANALLPLIRGQPIQTHRYEYPAYVGVSAILEDDGRATVQSGAAMHGATFQPKEAGTLLRVRVRVNGYSESDNRLVLALFMDADERPRAIASKPIAAGSASPVELDYETLLTNISPRAIQIRVGPAHAGRIFINGDAKGPSAAAPTAFIEYTESRAAGE